jgi:multiple sugar transport system ATP-binding protein
VAIGRAIVKQPKVFLFDEPLSNLDAALRVQTRLEIARLHKAIGTASMIYVTHDQVEAMTLADKIVLLHTGRLIEERGSIAQVGSPLTLYHRPASLFVAEFIGSPKMNILPGSLLGTEQVDSAAAAQVRVGEGLATQSLQVRANASGLALGQPVSVGVRPEHLRLAGADERANVLQGSLSHIERLGDSSLLYVEMSQGSPLLTVRVEGNSPLQPGDTVRVHAAATDLHLFDKDGLACPRTVNLPA